MKGAEDQFGKSDRNQAGGHQQKAVDHLRRAQQGVQGAANAAGQQFQEDLLAKLEALLRKMLAAQRAITSETEKTDGSVAERKGQLGRADELALKALSNREMDLTKDASEAKSLLEADGSTVVLLSVMADTRDLMVTVADLLAKLNCGKLTQGHEKDIEKALQDMIDAIQRERRQREQDQQQQQGQGQGQGQQQQRQLIQLSAELKMLKALQLRINHRTGTLEAERPKLPAADHGEQAAKLAEREAKVQGLTRDLSNKVKADQAAHGGGAM